MLKTNIFRGKKIIIGLLLIANIVLLFQAKERRRFINAESEYYKEVVFLKDRIFSYLISNHFIDTCKSNAVISSETSKKQLYFLFSEDDCGGCILNEIYNIEKKCDITKDVIFLGDYDNEHNLASFLSQNGYGGLRYITLGKSNLSFNKDDLLCKPFYFVLLNDGTYTMKFIPDIELNYLTLEYLSYVKTQHFK